MLRQGSPYLPVLVLILVLLGACLALTQAPGGYELVAYLLYALICLAVLVGLYLVVATAWMKYRNATAPIRRCAARVVRKWTRSYDYDAPVLALTWFSWPLRAMLVLLSRLGIMSLAATIYRQDVFWAVFQVGAQELDFAVPEQRYRALEAGQTGVLSYRGERFLDFHLAAGWEEGPTRLERD